MFCPPWPVWTEGVITASKTCFSVHTVTWLLFKDGLENYYLPYKSFYYLSLSLFLPLCVDPMPVQVAVPLSVGTNSAQLYIQRPQLGLVDGVKVCVCPGVCDTVCEGFCGDTCDWYALPAGVHIITVGNLSPGSEQQLRVYSTSREQMGPPYYTCPVRTSE